MRVIPICRASTPTGALHAQKKAYRAVADEPFTQLALRPPGESLRLEIEKLTEEFDSYIFATGAAGASCVVVTLTAPKQSQSAVGMLMLVLVLGATLWAGRKLRVLVRKLWDYRLGFMGERLVGEELNQLLSSGFRVFHDVPFDGFNVDHVLVGANDLFVVETKSRRKPKDIKGLERATVVFDGTALNFPKGGPTPRPSHTAR